MSHRSINDGIALSSHRQWMEEGHSEMQVSTRPSPEMSDAEHKRIILCKTAIAYGIAELTRQAARSKREPSPPPRASLDGQYSIDNFVVRTKTPGRRSRPISWKDIEGVDMLSPRLSVNIVEPSFLHEVNDGDQHNTMGRYLEAEFPSVPGTDDEAAVFFDQREEDERCQTLGVLLYKLFFNCSLISAGDDPDGRRRGSKSARENGHVSHASLEHVRTKIRLIDLRTVGIAQVDSTARVIRERLSALLRGERAQLSGEGIPLSLLLVIHNLLDCEVDDRPCNAYDSLDAMIDDFRLLLLDPRRFLFNHEPTYDNNGRVKLTFQEHHTYGRENEIAMITEAFCGVSSGKSESLFIGGFSGSGKSKLVNGLIARIDAVGGYVLTHKFDQLLQERSMLGVVALFNELCLLIIEKSSEQDLTALADDLTTSFGSDWSTLARLLPNIKALVSHSGRLADNEGEVDNQMNVQSICFTIQRFMRVVSSAKHPVVLFLDDLQWCDKSVFAVVESFLCDATGSACVLFVGTYRSNEVAQDHEIFCLEKRLTSFGVSTTMLSLEGLNPKDLNTMVSDALCIFPRITESLSDIIYQKTKGNPFFVLSFMMSLIDRGLLEYNFNTRRWSWDDDDISAMDITDNVLYLLSSKMSGLSTSIQSALKVAACFGIKIKESVIKTLSSDLDYSDIRDKLDHVVSEGFMVKCSTSDLTFAHDKVREAAYSLIPLKDKAQYHYNLGMSLFSITKGKVACDLIFSITDQIKHGIACLSTENSELRIDVAELFEMAGMKASASSDHVSSCSYLTRALSLLPTDHWKCQYDTSIRLSLRCAKSCYSCGETEKAQCILEDTMVHCLSLTDKLPLYGLLAKIFLDRKSFIEAYELSSHVLLQLGEEIPDSLRKDQINDMVEETSIIIGTISESDLLGMKDMEEKLSVSMGFYNILAYAAFLGKSEVFPFIACKMVKLTMENGLCKYSMFGFVIFASVLSCNNMATNRYAIASRVGTAVLSCSKRRYHTSEEQLIFYQAYYGYLGLLNEPLQTCAGMLRQGFNACMSVGETGLAFFNSVIYIRAEFMAGERLPIILEKVDNFLKLTYSLPNELNKPLLVRTRETISALIENGESSSSKFHANYEPTDLTSDNHLAGVYFHRAIQAYWRGYSERCQYFIGKFSSLLEFDTFRHLYVTFIEGLNAFQLLRNASSGGRTRAVSNYAAILTTIWDAIEDLRAAASFSSWNFQNKVHLLEAEQFSLQYKYAEAQASYVAAINTARSSEFIHEQGLACELAGYHCKRVSDLRSAWSYFDQAKRCYTKWGSKLKVDSVSAQLESLNGYSSGGPFSSS